MIPLAVGWPQPAAAVAPVAEEHRELRRFAAAKFEGVLPPADAGRGMLDANPPFSFTCDGKPSTALLKSWAVKRESRRLDDARTERTITYTDPRTGLVVRAVAVEYHDFPTIEWTVYLKNSAAADTPVLEAVHALDAHFDQSAVREFVLHHHTGDNCSPDSYQPHELRLGPRSEHRFAPPTGRPTTGAFPYFNLEWPGQGVIVVVGWPGQWQARFIRDEGNGVRVVAGQESTRFRLRSGEEVRTPLVVLQFWKGDRIRAQNVWRRWMIAHNMPRLGGKTPTPILAACSMAYFNDGSSYNEAGEKQFIDGFTRAGVRLDCWWLDAGWYVGGERG